MLYATEASYRGGSLEFDLMLGAVTCEFRNDRSLPLLKTARFAPTRA